MLSLKVPPPPPWPHIAKIKKEEEDEDEDEDEGEGPPQTPPLEQGLTITPGTHEDLSIEEEGEEGRRHYPASTKKKLVAGIEARHGRGGLSSLPLSFQRSSTTPCQQPSLPRRSRSSQ